MRARFVYESLNEELLNEELIGTVGTYDKTFEIYKNPRTVKRMDWWARGMSTDNGDFYVMTLKQDQIRSNYDAISVTHTHLSDYLFDKLNLGIVWKAIEGSGGYGYYREAIAWQRYKDSDKWYISESTSDKWIEDNMDYIKDKIDKVNKHNTQYLKLIPQRISKRYDNTTEFADADEYHREQEKEMY